MKQNIQIKPIDLKTHRVQLRKVLLTSSHWDRKQNAFLFLKGGEEYMNIRKIAVVSVALGCIALVMIAVSTFIPKSAKMAYAEQVASDSYQAVASLSPSQKEELKHKVRFDKPEELLAKARSAKDLKVLTYEQLAEKFPVPPSDAKTPDGKTPPDLRTFTFLQFTDTDGSSVTLGVDPSTDLPVFVSVMKKDGAPFKKGAEGKGNMMFKSSGKEPGKSIHFDSMEKGTNVKGVMNADGKGTIIVEGKRYVMPDGLKLEDGLPTIKVEGNDVYINGTKAVPQE